MKRWLDIDPQGVGNLISKHIANTLGRRIVEACMMSVTNLTNAVTAKIHLKSALCHG